MVQAVTPADTLAAAELRVQHARNRFHGTVAQLQDRLDVRPRAQRAAREATIVGQTAVAIAKEEPIRIGGAFAGALFALGLFLQRRRIARMFFGKSASPATAGLNPVTRTEP